MKTLKSILALATSFCLATGIFSAVSVNSIAYDSDYRFVADQGLSAEQIANSEVKPVLSLTKEVITLDEAKADPQRQISLTVSGANGKYAFTALHIYYDERLAIDTNAFGDIKAFKGEAAEYLSTMTPAADPNAPEGMKGIFLCSAANADKGLDGELWIFNFTLPDDVAEGDVFPIDILYKSNKTNEDMFMNVDRDETGILMQAYTFTQGIYNPEYNNNFKASADDVAKCATLANIEKSYDGYIAIANNTSSHVTRLGDANCDGQVTIADSTAILQSLGNPDKYGLSAEGAANADCCNPGDGILPSDALAIQKIDAKILDSLPEIIK